MLGGLYLPSSYGRDSPSGMILCSGKSVTSSIDTRSRGAGGFSVIGSGMSTSLSWALVSWSVALQLLAGDKYLLDVDVISDLVPVWLLGIVLLVREQIINFRIHC